MALTCIVYQEREIRDVQTHDLPLEEVGRGTRASLWSRHRAQQYSAEAACRLKNNIPEVGQSHLHMHYASGGRETRLADPRPAVQGGRRGTRPGIAIEAGLAHSSSRRTLRNSHDSEYGWILTATKTGHQAWKSSL